MMVDCPNCGMVYTSTWGSSKECCPRCGRSLRDLRQRADAEIERLRPLILDKVKEGCSFTELAGVPEGREFLSWYFASSFFEEVSRGKSRRLSGDELGRVDPERVGDEGTRLLAKYKDSVWDLNWGCVGDWYWASPADDRSFAVKVNGYVARLIFKEVES